MRITYFDSLMHKVLIFLFPFLPLSLSLRLLSLSFVHKEMFISGGICRRPEWCTRQWLYFTHTKINKFSKIFFQVNSKYNTLNSCCAVIIYTHTHSKILYHIYSITSISESKAKQLCCHIWGKIWHCQNVALVFYCNVCSKT